MVGESVVDSVAVDAIGETPSGVIRLRSRSARMRERASSGARQWTSSAVGARSRSGSRRQQRSSDVLHAASESASTLASLPHLIERWRHASSAGQFSGPIEERSGKEADKPND